jgi:hypothetical protein
MYRTLKTEEKLLREYVKRVLAEDDDGFVSSTDGGSPYGVSWGSGEDLYSTFVGPFVDVFKTAAGKSKEIGQRAKTLLFIAYKTVMTTLIPVYGYNYSDVFDKEKEKIDKIRGEYKEVYDRTESALKSGDAGMLAFLASPALCTAALAAAKGPGVAKDVLSGMTGGLSDDLFNKIKEKAIEAGRWSLGEDDEDKKKRKREKRKDYQRKSPKDSSAALDSIGESRLLEKKLDKSPLTPEKILKSKNFINKSLHNPKVTEMQKVATETYRSSLDQVYTQAENLLKNAKTIDDLEKFAKKKIPDAEKIRNLQGDEKVKAEKMLIDGIRKSMKDFYVKNLSDQVNRVIKAGIPEEAQYIKDYRATIQKIKAL